MNDADMKRFFQALDTLGEFFADTLTPLRQRVYWNIFQAVDIEAWESACMQAMATETFHKVPLPAVLMAHVHAYLAEQRANAQTHAQTALGQWYAKRVALIDAAEETGIPPPRDEIPPEARAMLDRLFGPNAMHDIPVPPAYETSLPEQPAAPGYDADEDDCDSEHD